MQLQSRKKILREGQQTNTYTHHIRPWKPAPQKTGPDTPIHMTGSTCNSIQRRMYGDVKSIIVIDNAACERRRALSRCRGKEREPHHTLKESLEKLHKPRRRQRLKVAR